MVNEGGQAGGGSTAALAILSARIRPQQPRHRCLEGDSIVSCAAGGSGTHAREHAQLLDSNAVLVQHGRAIRRRVERRVWQRQPALHASIHLPCTMKRRGARAQPLVARNVAPTDVRATRSGVCGANPQSVRRCTRGCRPRIDADVHIPEHVTSGRSGATVLMAGILSSSPRTRLPNDQYTAFLIMPATLSNASATAAAVTYSDCVGGKTRSSCLAFPLPEN
jgi:hypothetical protein